MGRGAGGVGAGGEQHIHPELCRDMTLTSEVPSRSWPVVGIWAQAPGLGWDVDVGAVIPEMGFKVCMRLKEEIQGLSPAHPNILTTHSTTF